MIPRSGDAQPLHPDQYGRSFARVLSMQLRDDDEILASMPAMTDEEMAAAWDQEQETHILAARPHTHMGCSHRCRSGACVVMAGINDPLCIPCQLAEVSDNERHRASRAARRKSA